MSNRRLKTVSAAVTAVVGLVAVTATMAAPQALKVLGRDSTTRSYGSASIRVYLRDDPDYKRELRALQADLAEAQRELREARESIAQVGELTPEQKRSQQEFLAPYVRAVKDVKADLADLAADYARPFRAYGFRVQASSSQQVRLEWKLTCSRGRVESALNGEITKQTPFELWRPPTLRRAYSCYLLAYTSRNADGRMVTTLLGKR